IACRGNGETTVSATISFASKVAGIKVFVTGGIGGVHRQGESRKPKVPQGSYFCVFNFVFIKLLGLNRTRYKTPVAVVCAGVKSILDIPRTLEYLVRPSYSARAYSTDEFPAFFTPKSG
ncbi:hypothetical protein SELMODRAFT_109791, partial [Selaginella moellendorffii]